jgi:RNA polymerase subunit RPABC4/transcription elongation factor Spt4
VSERVPEPTLVECANCRRQVPDGSFCGHCGASLSTATALSRRHAYAASPAESVYHVGLATTLFPHLTRWRGALFAWCLLAGVAVTVVLVGLNLFAAAAAVAVLLLPVLYLLYLYEARVYADRPWLVMGLAFGLPLVLGVLLTLVLGTAITGLALAGDWSLRLLLELVIDPVLALLATLIGPLLLLSRRTFDDVLDAVTFGATSGLAFALGQTGVAVWPLLTGRVVSEGVPVQWALLLLRQGVLLALVSMATASLLATALWMRRRAARSRLDDRWLWHPALMVAVAVAARIAAVALGLSPRLLLDVVGVALVVFLLFLYLRLVVHNALLEEGPELEIGAASPCPECHRLVPAMRFCPACGVARSAAPKPPTARRGTAPAPRPTKTH